MNSIEAVDLFCGIGGLTYGLQESGIKVLAGIDNDETCQYAYEKNNNTKFINADITKFTSKNITELYSQNSIKVLVGCAPCQPFSTHSNKYKDKLKDTRWNMLTHFGKIIDEVKPDIVSMENVRGIINSDVFQDFIEVLKINKYYVDYKIVFAPDYGAPQSRYRLILLASKFGNLKVPNSTCKKGNYKTVRHTIGELPRISFMGSAKKDKLHQAMNLTDINVKRIKQSVPNGTWKDWDQELLPNCYRKKSGETYKSVYGRMNWDQISPTITTQFYNYGTGRFGHPDQDRALSLREGALLQTFPKEYDFGNIISFKAIGRHIGNAVPPLLGKIIGDAIIKHMGDNSDRNK